MAFIHRAVDPGALRRHSKVADATEVTIYDADFPNEVGQHFVSAIFTDGSGREHTLDLTDPAWSDLNDTIEEEAAVHGETVKFVLDLGGE